jgi:hypothetical protein
VSEEGTVGCSGCGLGLDPHGPNCPAGSDQFGDFTGLLSLAPGPTLVDHKQGPLTFELLDELINDLPRREAAQHQAHMDFILNQNKWQNAIMGRMRRTGYIGGLDATTRQMIHNMKFGATYTHCIMDEGKLPRFTRLRKHLFKKTIK